jgi:ATP-dependent helicase IRC3
LINWAEFDPLTFGAIGGDPEDWPRHPPVQIISIELVRKLAVQMDSGININTVDFLMLLPVGWSRVEYAAMPAEDGVNEQPQKEDVELVSRLVMVFDHEKESYAKLIDYLSKNSPKEFYDEGVQFEQVEDVIYGWMERFFPSLEKHFGSSISQDIFVIARHISQHGSSPKFFDFEERRNHDLDKVIDNELSVRAEDDVVRLEWNKKDRYWQVFYPTYELFKTQYNACRERIIFIERNGMPPLPPIGKGQSVEPEVLGEILRRQIIEGDGGCLCCGSKRWLQVDHIIPRYFGGPNNSDNLQTLCKKCNGLKGNQRINFRDNHTDLSVQPTKLPSISTLSGKHAGSSEEWSKFLNRTINFFYKCKAVHSVTIGEKGDNFYHWIIQHKAGNNPIWLEPYLPELLYRIREAKDNAGFMAPETITANAPGEQEVTYSMT